MSANVIAKFKFIALHQRCLARCTDALRNDLLMRAVFSIGLIIVSMAALGAQSPHALIRSGKFLRRRSS